MISANLQASALTLAAHTPAAPTSAAHTLAVQNTVNQNLVDYRSTEPSSRQQATPVQYPAIALVGPTASGKSALAMRLSEHYPIEIISVDSALVYQDMDIGTAKPSLDERRAVPHHLIDILSPREAYSAAQFTRDCQGLIAQIQARGRLPLLVGGTMLYIKALREGLHDLPSSDAQIRAEVAGEAKRVGWPAMHAKLQTIDPKTAARLQPLDAQRVGRALEVYLQTGQSLSHFLQLQDKMPNAASASINLISLEPQNRAHLHQRIAERFDLMLEQGLIQEVERVYALVHRDAELPSMRCVGYRQVVDAIEGRAPWESLRERGVAATRQLAKRQLTWLRGMEREVVASEEAAKNPEGFLQLIAKFLSKSQA